MSNSSANAASRTSGELTTDTQASSPQPSPAVTDAHVSGQFSAVINIHACNLQQIEAAIAANRHAFDPHPASASSVVRRHPIYLACFDASTLDLQGRPSPGKPLELDLDTIRSIFASRHSYVSPDAPPEDGSHIQVPGMHTVAERDITGQPTGRVHLGTPDEAAG